MDSGIPGRLGPRRNLRFLVRRSSWALPRDFVGFEISYTEVALPHSGYPKVLPLSVLGGDFD